MPYAIVFTPLSMKDEDQPRFLHANVRRRRGALSELILISSTIDAATTSSRCAELISASGWSVVLNDWRNRSLLFSRASAVFEVKRHSVQRGNVYWFHLDSGRVLIRAGRVLEPRPSGKWIRPPTNDSHGAITRFSTPKRHVQSRTWRVAICTKEVLAITRGISLDCTEHVDGIFVGCFEKNWLVWIIDVWIMFGQIETVRLCDHEAGIDIIEILSLWRVAHHWCSSNSSVRIWSSSIDQWDFPEVQIEPGSREVSHLICFSNVHRSNHWMASRVSPKSDRMTTTSEECFVSTKVSFDATNVQNSRPGKLKFRRVEREDGWHHVDRRSNWMVSNRLRKCELSWRSSVG